MLDCLAANSYVNVAFATLSNSLKTKPWSAANSFKSVSVIAIPNDLILSLSPNNALVNACDAPSAPPEKFVKDARSTANSLTCFDKFNASDSAKPNPTNKSPVLLSKSFAANDDKPNDSLNVFAVALACSCIELNTVLNFASVSSKSDAILIAAPPAKPNGNVNFKDISCPIFVTLFPNDCNFFCDADSDAFKDVASPSNLTFKDS